MGVDMAARAKGTGRAKGPPATSKATATSRAATSRAATSRAATPEAPEPDHVAAPSGQRPAALRLAAAAQAIEALGLCVAAVFAAVSTADGKSYQAASGIAVTLIAFGAAAGLAAIAVGLAKAKPWSRTPAVMTQLFVVISGVALLDGHRPEWGVPALLLAVTCVAGLLTPASLRALNRPRSKTSSAKRH
jgi:hypothetical protein